MQLLRGKGRGRLYHTWAKKVILIVKNSTDWPIGFCHLTFEKFSTHTHARNHIHAQQTQIFDTHTHPHTHTHTGTDPETK